jgi:hypothetical protein
MKGKLSGRRSSGCHARDSNWPGMLLKWTWSSWQQVAEISSNRGGVREYQNPRWSSDCWWQPLKPVLVASSRPNASTVQYWVPRTGRRCCTCLYRILGTFTSNRWKGTAVAGCCEKGSTYNVGLCLAVVTGREATLTALSGGRLQVRRKSATGHCVCVGCV